MSPSEIAGFSPFFGRIGGMGHGSGVLDQGLAVAQADGDFGQLHAVDDLFAGLKAAFDFKGDNAAEPAVHLPGRRLVPGMVFKAGVVDAFDGGMPCEEARDAQAFSQWRSTRRGSVFMPRMMR